MPPTLGTLVETVPTIADATADLLTAGVPVVLCDSCDRDDVPATREAVYLLDPNTPDERTSRLPICGRDECATKALAYIDSAGDFLRIEDL